MWWVCDDAPEAAYRLKEALADEGLHWYTAGGWSKPTALWLTTSSGDLDDGEEYVEVELED